MLRINIIEPLNHGEVVNTLLHLLGNKCEINVYTKSSNQKFIDQSAQNINCSYYKSEHSLNFFLVRNWKTLNNCDVLIFTTLPKYTQLFALRRITTKSILIVHNANTLFDRKNNIANSKSITNSLLIRTRVFGKQIFKDPFTKVFLKKIRYISFLDESMLTYLSSKKLIPGNSQKYISIPLFYYKETQDYIPQINEINIVIIIIHSKAILSIENRYSYLIFITIFYAAPT